MSKEETGTINIIRQSLADAGLADNTTDDAGLLYLWLKDSLQSWFTRKGPLSFYPVADSFIGQDDFDILFSNFYHNRLEPEKLAGKPSEQALFLRAAQRLVSERGVYSGHSKEFLFLLNFICRTDAAGSIGQLTRLIGEEAFLAFKTKTGRWLAAEVIRAVYESRICDDQAVVFFRKAANALAAERDLPFGKSPDLIPLIVTKRLDLANNNMEKLNVLLDSAQLIAEYRQYLAETIPPMLLIYMGQLEEDINKQFEKTFIVFIAKQPEEIRLQISDFPVYLPEYIAAAQHKTGSSIRTHNPDVQIPQMETIGRPLKVHAINQANNNIISAVTGQSEMFVGTAYAPT